MEHQDSMPSGVNLNERAIEALRVSGQWSYFLAILGFIGIGLMLIAGLFMGMGMASASRYGGPAGDMMGGMGGIFTVFYFVLAAIYFFPVFYLFRYASGIRSAVAVRNEEAIADALTNLKTHHKILGIMMIVLICLYILAIIGAIMMFSFAASQY
jgi:hypothetical protein